MTSTWPITWLLSTALAPILGHQFLLNYIKDKHQPSSRDLLLTISTSIGKYLYESQLREKTHNQEQGNTPLNPRKKVPTNQKCHSASHGSMDPLKQATDLGQGRRTHNY